MNTFGNVLLKIIDRYNKKSLRTYIKTNCYIRYNLLYYVNKKQFIKSVEILKQNFTYIQNY